MRENVVNLKKMYPPGTRIRLIHMDDNEPTPIPDGTTGIVSYVDDAGTIHMTWNNGSSLGLIPDVDLFTVIK